MKPIVFVPRGQVREADLEKLRATGREVIEYMGDTPPQAEEVSLRDKFAMAAIGGMFADPGCNLAPCERAVHSYKQADEMLKARA